MFEQRLNLSPNQHNVTEILKRQRNDLRQQLIEHQQAQHLTSLEPLMVRTEFFGEYREINFICYLHPKTWFYGLMRDVLQHSNGNYGLGAYFEFLTVEVHWCTGSPSNGPHLEVHSPPRRTSYYQVSMIEQDIYNSSIRLWFEDFSSIKTAYTSRDACWRVKDGVPLCSGNRQDSPRLVISTPVLLIIEAPEDSETNTSAKFKDLPPWDFPLTLTPSTITKSEAKRKGITYNLIGLGLFSKSSRHFIARYSDKETSQIYTYDSMKNNGNAISDPELNTGELATHRASRVQTNIPPSYAPSLAIYLLRGGVDAQQAFYQNQTKACSKMFNLQFSTADLSTLPDVTYCGQECPIVLDPGPHQKKKGLKEYISKKLSESELSESPKDNNSLAVSSRVEALPSPLIVVDQPESEEETVPLHPHGKPALKIDTKPRIAIHTASESSDSPPDSPFNINCRCGLKGNGNVFYDEKEGEVVQCTECENWSHIACQRNGRASKLRAKEAFYCDFCQVRVPGMGKSEKDRFTERRCVDILIL